MWALGWLHQPATRMSQQPDGMYQIALKERAMQQPKTKHDRSAYEQSVDRLASAMREMLGMGGFTCFRP
jgi:hypothetical protein